MQTEKLDAKKIGQRVKETRKKNHMTQEVLGKEIGRNAKYISALENGRSRPSLESLVALSKVLNVSTDFFLMDAPGANPTYTLDTEMADRARQMTSTTRLACINIMDQLLTVQNSVADSTERRQSWGDSIPRK